MQIKKITIEGFRCIRQLEILFEKDFTIIVGENDCGKTSLIDCLKVITQAKTVEFDDFLLGSDRIYLSIEIADFIFWREFHKNGDAIAELPLAVRPSNEYISRIRSTFESRSFDITVPDNQELVRENAKLCGLVVRSNSILATLKDQVIEAFNKLEADPQSKLSATQFPKFNNIQLDGKQFENVSSFFKEVFLKEKQNSIWQERLDSGISIEEFVKEKIDSYSEEISKKIVERGIQDKVKLFLKDLTEIRVEPIYQTRDLNIDAKVKFIKDGNEINIQKKGDGTKRRITLALLEIKKEQVLLENDSSTIYLLDEPDTHLHAKAQIELLKTLEEFAKAGNQVIITTHSPFIMNAVKPNQIRVLSLDEHSNTKLKHLHDAPELSSAVLQSIGVENVYLFFARTLVIVEGETELSFIANYYLKKNGNTINADLIKIINVEGIQNVYGFAKGLAELHDPKRILAVYDNDASEELSDLINRLSLQEENKFVIGKKEFEDSFTDEVLHHCWLQFHDECGHGYPPDWTIENLKQVRKSCEENPNLKFSEEIKQLNAKGKKMTKPVLGYALGKFIQEEEMPTRFLDLFKIM